MKHLKGLILSVLILLFSVSSLSAVESSGYIEVHIYPPHNEFDPNTGVAFKDRVVARYGLELNEEIKLGNLYLFVNPFVLFGDSRPQTDYNYSAAPIALNLNYGAGYGLSDNLAIRVTHGHWIDLGGYAGERLQWNSISLKYSW